MAAQISGLYGSMLRGFLIDALDDRNDVEDVMQQTLTDAWRRGATYDPERGSLATWLLMIARSRAVAFMCWLPPKRRRSTWLADKRDGPGVALYMPRSPVDRE